MSKTSWIKESRPYKLEPVASGKEDKFYTQKLFLNEQFDSVDEEIPGLTTQLCPHQRVTVRAMMDVEKTRVVPIDITGPKSDSLIKPVIETCGAVLSEKMGSGKTFEILALILLQPIPPAVAEITSIPTLHNKDITSHSFKSRSAFMNAGYSMEVRRMYKNTLRQTLIFVGKAVMTQWEDTIAKFTNLKAYSINDIFDLRIFYEMMFHPTKKNNHKVLEQYDIILVKNGNISGKFDVPELDSTNLKGVKSKPIINVFSELFKDTCYARVVLDDFDVLGVPTNATVIPALFTWLVSATKKPPPGRRNLQTYYSLKDILRSYRPTYANAWVNRDLFTFFNLGNEDGFIDESVSASKVNFYTYTFVNPNDVVIGALGAMGTEEATAFAEMFNADAMKTAAAKAGVKTTSVKDIFEKILNSKWTVYKKNMAIARYIPRIKEIIRKLPSLHDPKKAITQAGLENLKKNMRKPGPISAVSGIVKYQQSAVDDLVSEVETANNHEKEENGKAIQRVKDSLQAGDCPIMATPLKEAEAIIIMTCCGVVISYEAAQFGLKIHTTGGGRDISGTCPRCRRECNSQTIIIIDKEIKLDDIIHEENVIEEDDDVKLPEAKPAATQTLIGTDLDDVDEGDFDLALQQDNQAENEEDDKELNKYNCIVKIIKGDQEAVKEVRQKRDDIRIASLLMGTSDKGDAAPTDKKVLVFANFRETITILEEKFNKNNITYMKLHGTTRQIADIVERFNKPNSDPESISVLLINGTKFCAGLNLQAATDLIYAHKVMDANIESQIGGRAARFGRKWNLNIHYVLYQNEYQQMFASRLAARPSP
jgi:SNF2 family DNA or RNA helicase